METTHGAVTWHDIRLKHPRTEEMPPQPELEKLGAQFNIHPLIIKELETPSARARVETYENYLFLVYQFPVYDPEEKVSPRAEIDFIITQSHVITVGYENMWAFSEFARRLQQGEIPEPEFKNTFQLTYLLIEDILNFNQRQLRHIGEKVEEVSLGLFKENEREMLQLISYVKRDISEYRVIFSPQAQLLSSLQSNGAKFWGVDAAPYLNDLVGDHLRLMNQLEDYRGAVLDYESTNNQLLNLKSNEVMKTLTLMAFITFPLVPLIGLFTVHLKGIPLVEHPFGFWMLTGLCILAVSAMLMVFKAKKWL